MLSFRVAILALSALVLASCGRGEGPPLYSVHGKVIFNGQPAVGATLMFQREDAPPSSPNSAPLVPVGQADEEGNFSLETGELGYGAPAGKYKVLIQWRTKIDGNAAPVAASPKKSRYKLVADKPDGVPDRLEGRYMKPDTARIRVEVKPETNNLEPFEVSS
jgi:hypothetical protein